MMKSKNEEIKKRLIPEIYKIYGMEWEIMIKMWYIKYKCIEEVNDYEQ